MMVKNTTKKTQVIIKLLFGLMHEIRIVRFFPPSSSLNFWNKTVLNTELKYNIQFASSTLSFTS